VAVDAGGGLEADISWHSALHFKDLSPEWTPLYTSDGQPVVIERAFGTGSIVLAADSFFLSNEALREERHPQLLGRIFRGPATVIFDEEHLGVSEQPGIATLARKYRLHGAVAVLALVAALFVWKSVAPFIPPRAESDTPDVIAGKETSAGFVSLLRRAIPPGEVLGACVEEWRKTARPTGRERAQFDEAWAAEEARPPKRRDPPGAYRALCAALARRR
jgi:hypothetical protein